MAGMGPKSLAFLVAGSLCLAAEAQLTIGGSVYEDKPALALRQHFIPLPGVSLKLYRDGGDRVPTADDTAAGSATTNAAGVYSFRVERAGDYWVAVDSRTVRGGAAWAEQTFGPSGALCDHPDGTARATYFEGPCFGGRTGASDDASALATSEHVAGVTLRETAADVDFAFSFDAVTSTADAGRAQGSLRQFVVNANTIDGPNRMRFVPLQRAPEQRETTMGVPPRWWSIILATALPEITGDDTILDGTAYNFLSPASVVNVHPGRLGEPATIRPDERQTARQEKPELELIVTGTSGIVCTGSCAVRSLAIHGPAMPVLVRADARFEHVIIGAAPDGSVIPGGNTGLRIDGGLTVARHLFVTSQSAVGIYVAPGARLDAERLDVTRCGAPLTGGGIVVLSDGSSIRSSLIAANPGAGIVLGATDGSRPANGNTVDGSTISSNQAGIVLSPGSSRNVITRNDIMWNRLGGVTVAPFDTASPRENRVSANRFDENGLRPIVLDAGAEEPNALRRPGEGCNRTEAAANGGISPPRIASVRVENERVVIRGRACPGEIVELYQSFVTSGVRQAKAQEMPDIRNDETERESMTNEGRTLSLPSIGEFNYLGATNTSGDGTFEAIFPFPALTSSDRARSGIDSEDEETDIWASEVMPAAKPEERAFSAIAIDPAGNTSEMSVRRKVD
jgi:parallel beta-helix repeat protein